MGQLFTALTRTILRSGLRRTRLCFTGLEGDLFGFRPEDRRYHTRRHFEAGPHGLPTRALRCNLGQSLLHPLLLRPPWPQSTSQLTVGGLVRVPSIRNHKSFSTYGVVFEYPQTGMLKHWAFMSTLPYTDAGCCCHCVGLSYENQLVQQRKF